MYTLPAVVILRARTERVLLNPDDVMCEGELMQTLGASIPEELVEHCSRNRVHIFVGDDGKWYAEPLKA
jgi:hypothetical protein